MQEMWKSTRRKRMKKIGETTEGNVLIEATQEEYLILTHLAAAVEGKSLEDIHLQRDYSVLFDYSGVFGAIEAFTLAHYRTNELQALLDRFKDAMNRE
jgi:hypothetical protein